MLWCMVVAYFKSVTLRFFVSMSSSSKAWKIDEPLFLFNTESIIGRSFSNQLVWEKETLYSICFEKPSHFFCWSYNLFQKGIRSPTKQLKAVNYFCKKLHLRCLTGLWKHPWILSLKPILVTNFRPYMYAHMRISFYKKFLSPTANFLKACHLRHFTKTSYRQNMNELHISLSCC